MNNKNNISLQINNLNIGYKSNKPLLQDLTFEFTAGNFIGLIGNNGVGKSTLLKTICGLIKPLNGEIKIDGENSIDINSVDLAKLVSIVLTDKVEGFNLTVFDVVSSGRYPYTGYFGNLSSEDIEITERAISICGIEHIKNKSISEVSDGERQKALIAKALSQQTPIILLDEPTAFLDYNSKKNTIQLLKSLCVNEGKIILLSSHDLEILLKHIDKAILIEENNTCKLESIENLKNKFLI